MFKKILVPYDGSENAGRALTAAKDLAEKYSAELYVLSVVRGPQSDVTPVDPMMRTAADKQSLESQLTGDGAVADARKLVEGFQGKVTYKVLPGAAVSKILYTIDAEGCDLVVLGCRGLSGLKKLFLGSVSDAIASSAPVHVLIVK